MPAQITLAQLRKAGACKSQVVLFKKRFGESVRVTEDLACQYGPEFDIEWASQHLLSPSAYEVYRAAMASVCTARVPYAVVMASARIPYAAVSAVAYFPYVAAMIPAHFPYNVASTVAYVPYVATMIPAYVPYAAFSAMAFARAYLADR
jgi:hypothetical protein